MSIDWNLLEATVYGGSTIITFLGLYGEAPSYEVGCMRVTEGTR